MAVFSSVNSTKRAPVHVCKRVVQRRWCNPHHVGLAHVTDYAALLQRLENGHNVNVEQNWKGKEKEKRERHSRQWAHVTHNYTTRSYSFALSHR